MAVLMGSLSGSLAAHERLRAFDAETLVPGHGDVWTPEVLDGIGAYLRFVRDTAAAARPAVLTPLEAAREANLSGFVHLSEPERLVGNLHRAYAELDGAPGAPIDLPAAVADMVAFNGGRPLRCYA